MNDFLKRARTLLTALPTYLVLTATMLQVLIEELQEAELVPSVVAVLLRVAAVVGAAIEIVRRSTPVLKGERGLLPKGEQ